MGCQNHLFWGARGVIRRVWCFHRRVQDSWSSYSCSFYSTSFYTTPALESLEHGSFVICLHPSEGCLVVGWLFADLRQITIRSLSQRVWYSMINHQRKDTPLGGGSNWSQNNSKYVSNRTSLPNTGETQNMFETTTWQQYRLYHTLTLKRPEKKVNTYKTSYLYEMYEIQSTNLLDFPDFIHPWACLQAISASKSAPLGFKIRRRTSGNRG